MCIGDGRSDGGGEGHFVRTVDNEPADDAVELGADFDAGEVDVAAVLCDAGLCATDDDDEPTVVEEVCVEAPGVDGLVDFHDRWRPRRPPFDMYLTALVASTS